MTRCDSSPTPRSFYRSRGLLAALALAHAVGSACAPEGRAAGGPTGGSGTPLREAPNVLFLTIDTLRADRLTPYGYGRPTSPAIAELAQSSVVFEEAQASSSWTLPTLASVVTGHYSSTHRCWKRKSRLSPAFDTLPELLRDAGYDTAAAISHLFLARRYGLQQGITHFDTSFDRPVAHGDTAVSSPGVTERGLGFLRHQAESPDAGPWFLWLHYFDPHFKYTAHGGDSAQFGEDEPSDRYDGEIRYTDGYLGEVLESLEDLGLADSTVVVLFADHGEEFGEHGELYHGHTLHRELVRVPLMIRAPGFPSGRVSTPVRTVDLMPTVLELVGLDVPAELPGVSLVPALAGGESSMPSLRSTPALSEVRLFTGPNQFESLVEGDWKLLVRLSDRRASLYSLRDDPGEMRDVAAEEHERVAEMQMTLEGVVREAREAGEIYAPVAELGLSSDEQDVLNSLGYTGDTEEEGAEVLERAPGQQEDE